MKKIPFLNEEASLDTLLFDKYASKESFKGEDISHQEISHVLKANWSRKQNRVIIGHLNVNFFCNEIRRYQTIIPGNVDIMVFGVTKLDDSHPIAQTLIEGFAKSFRLDRNEYGVGILIYVRSDIPCRQLNTHEFCEKIEGYLHRNLFPEIKMALTWDVSSSQSK